MATDDGPQPRDIVTSRAFERDVKRLRKRGFDLEPLWDLVEAIRSGQPLDARHRDHALEGELGRIPRLPRPGRLTVYLTRTGTHSDIFG
jgi:mRNA interferase YafQ